MTLPLPLPQVTLCAASSVNVPATLCALEASLAQLEFGAVKLFTDASVQADPRISVVPVPRILSARDYSDFLLRRMVDHVDTDYCLIVQWDGHVLDATRWRPEFLEYDYIGARWPQFEDGHDVGNGGFSLRSLRLMHACREPEFAAGHPEDVAVGRTNRVWLEGRGMRFAPHALADSFSAERSGDVTASFGYHGAWLMPQAIGVDAFWQVYCTLDDRSTIWRDFTAIVRQTGRGRGGLQRATRLAADRARHTIATGRWL